MGKSIRSSVKKYWRSELRQRVGKPYERVQFQIVQNNLKKTLRGSPGGSLSKLQSAMGQGGQAMDEDDSDSEESDEEDVHATRLDNEKCTIAKQGGLGASAPSKKKEVQYSDRYRSFNDDAAAVTSDLKPRFSFVDQAIGGAGKTMVKAPKLVIQSTGNSAEYTTVVHTILPLEQLGVGEGAGADMAMASKKKSKPEAVKRLTGTYEYGVQKETTAKKSNFVVFHPTKKKGHHSRQARLQREAAKKSMDSS